jgi:hypothetical protein
MYMSQSINGVVSKARGLEQQFSALSLAITKLIELISKLTEDEALSVNAAERKEVGKRMGAGRPGGASGVAQRRGKVVGGNAGPAGFLWKPVSDSTGKLAILLPPSFTGRVSGVSVLSPEGRLIESGRDGGVGNGGREHFRFSRAGSEFPSGSIVAIRMLSGEVERIRIDRPGSRIEGR